MINAGVVLSEAAALQPASGVFSLIWVLVALPLLGALILLVGGRGTNSWGHRLGVATIAVDAVLAVAMLFVMMAQPAEDRGIHQQLYHWVFAGRFSADVAFQLDQLSMVFVLLITIVGLLIHIYSVGYMSHDPDRRKFFGYLNLFVAAMLLLVLADNYLLLYVGWEGVGLASFLLIGFWQHKNSAAAAAKKAFIINRVGDVGLSLAIMFMFVAFGSVTFSTVFPQASTAGDTTLTWIGLLLLLAACGKSAQFPLQAWLLDAMEGPTPVSALIHAATMVTAGVYLITRSNAIFDGTVVAATAVVIVGTITMLMGAIIGAAKDDIKKSLAGSTMSQIGYMVLAAGLGPVGYVFAIFHLLTHGVFKAGLFLGAGSVMHGMNDQVDMRRYGALRGFMALTYIGFLSCTLAIMGIPPFAGFWSKDDIIHAAFESNLIVGICTILAAGITGFYMTRMLIMTFFGKARWEDDAHPHESPKVMTIPVTILASVSVVMGFLLLYWADIETWLEPVTGYRSGTTPIPGWSLIAITLVVVLLGALLAWMKYGRREVPAVAPAKVSWVTKAARRNLFDDATNDALVVQPTFYLSRLLVWFDTRVIDGIVHGSAALVGGASGRLRRIQTGYARSYALTMVIGLLLIVVAFALVRL